TGFASCDGNTANGCETAVTTDVNDCGGCGIVCSSSHVAVRACTNGVCTGTCSPGFADCNNNKQKDGGETPVATDVNNCGGCGLGCPAHPNGAPTCVNGACSLSCTAGFANCNGSLADGCETNLMTDHDNCGSCGHVCLLICTNGTCQ